MTIPVRAVVVYIGPPPRPSSLEGLVRSGMAVMVGWEGFDVARDACQSVV